MITNQTLFILGAGASNPYHYPLGTELSEAICDRLPDLIDSFIRPGKKDEGEKRNFKILKQEADLFINAFLNTSDPIDLFLSRRHQFGKIGKIAIVLAILESEIESEFGYNMKSDKSNNKKKYDWYTLIFKKLTAELSTQESYKNFTENKLNIITFNYDRSLEYFLSNNLRYSFNLNPYQIKETLKYINFIHVYGQVPMLPWQNPNGFNISYKQSYFPDGLLNLDNVINNIYLMNERETIKTDIIHKLIKKADKIYFLGFSYLEENMKILNILYFIS